MLRQMRGEFNRLLEEDSNPFLYEASSVKRGVPMIWDVSIAADKELPLSGAYIVIEQKNADDSTEAYGIVVSGIGDGREAYVWWYRNPGVMSTIDPRSLSYEDIMDTVLNTTGTIVDVPIPTTFDEETFSWYFNGVNVLFPKYNTEIVFSELYEDPLFPGASFLSCFCQLRNSTHMLGIFGMDLTLQSIQEFMIQEHARWNLGAGVAFIMNAADHSLIATSSNAIDPSTYTHLTKANENGKSIIDAGSGVHSLHVEGLGDVLLAVDVVDNGVGINWVVCVAYRESEFTGELDTMDVVTSVVSVACMLIATATVICASMCFMIPLHRLKTEMRKVELMQLEDVKAQKSIFYEVFSIQASFYAMKEKLRLWKAYLPEHVLLAEGLSADAFEEDKEKRERADDETAYTVSHESEQESKVSKVHSRTSGSLSDKSKELEQNLGLKSVYRTASSVVIRIANYKKLAQNQAAFIDQHGLIMDRIRKICARVNAVLDYFDERQFHVSLNAMLPVKHFQQAAVRVALMIEITTKKANVIFTHDKREKMELVFGISSGSTYCGTIGTSTLRKNCIYGPARENALALSAVAESMLHLGVTILIDASVEKCLDKSGYKYRPIGLYAFRITSKLVPVYHVATTKDTKAAEWMYAINEETTFAEWTPLHKAFSHLKRSRFQEALTELHQLPPDDIVVQRWMRFCKRMIAEERSYHAIQRVLDETSEETLKEMYRGGVYVDALTTLLDVRKGDDKHRKE